MKRFLPAICLLTTAGSLLACPVCDTETGKQVREGIFGKDFYKNVLVTVAPFPVVLGLIAVDFRLVPDWKHADSRWKERRCAVDG
jgi:hypothetical protein